MPIKKVKDYAASKADETKLKAFGNSIANREVHLEINGQEYFIPDPKEYKQDGGVLLLKKRKTPANTPDWPPGLTQEEYDADGGNG